MSRTRIDVRSKRWEDLFASLDDEFKKLIGSAVRTLINSNATEERREQALKDLLAALTTHQQFNTLLRKGDLEKLEKLLKNKGYPIRYLEGGTEDT